MADDGIGHTVWVVPAELTAPLVEAFTAIPALYVADGHHRTASAARVGIERKAANPHHTGDEPYNYFMAVVFPHDQLKIMDYNRVVKDLNGLTPESFLAQSPRSSSSPRMPRPTPSTATSSACTWAAGGTGWTPGPAPTRTEDPVRSLDVAILQDNLLAPILGIADPRTDKRIDFVGGIRGLGELEKRVNDGWAVAFALHPTSLDQLMAVADSGQVMPPKSTWFEPKLRSGLLVRTLDIW